LLNSTFILLGQFILFVLGIYISGDALKVIKAAFFAPVFLVWKMVIDFVSFTGIYHGEKWIRTKRHISK
jgi:hypothetical protein